MGGFGGAVHTNDVWRSGDGGSSWKLLTSNAGWSGKSFT